MLDQVLLEMEFMQIVGRQVFHEPPKTDLMLSFLLINTENVIWLEQIIPKL